MTITDHLADAIASIDHALDQSRARNANDYIRDVQQGRILHFAERYAWRERLRFLRRGLAEAAADAGGLERTRREDRSAAA